MEKTVIKQAYDITFKQPYYYLRKKVGWWIFKWWKTVGWSWDYDYIEEAYKKLTDKSYGTETNKS
jgi:hypothetical protein